MPELVEVEMYRRLAAASGLGRPIAKVVANDAWYLKGGSRPEDVAAALLSRSLTGARRRGKLLLLDTSDDGPVLGLRFGMSGRLVIDASAGVERLLYSASTSAPAYDRFSLHFGDGGTLRMSDPRRLGGVELDPDETRLGPDAARITVAELRALLQSGKGPLKARLLDQSRVAGIGNLLADEVLWRAGLAPTRPAGSLDAAEIRRLQRNLIRTVAELTTRGGSHRGDLMAERRTGGRCPKDGAALIRSTVGGRTSWWCSLHQR